ncbi:MAG: histidinol dehydrogenase [Bacteroidetes bacterium]|nr:histidinol dehydrogenase [Bacteroidota bacterium]
MRIIEFPDRNRWTELATRPVSDLSVIQKKVRPVLKAVQLRGDEAVKQFTEQFDGVLLNKTEVEESEILAAENKVSDALKSALKTAASNIEKFHIRQKNSEEVIETTSGITCWRRSIAIEHVGLYIPGGSAPLFSTVLMLAIPASIAGCSNIVLCTPPNEHGKIHPAILYAARLCGVHRIFKIGGAQAIAAMAYGTASVPQVHKIFGPGNQFVTAAKQLVTEDGLAIDMPAGPSEVAVIADDSVPAKFIAADLIAQAEHGPDSQSLLLTDSAALAGMVNSELEKQLTDLPRISSASASLSNSAAIVFNNLDEAMDFSNLYGPEHLILAAQNYNELSSKIINAGSVFLGLWTPESLGDYASGTNHTLPTNGWAKTYSGVSVDSFVKKVTFQKATETGLRNIGPTVETMAAGEELEGHKRAVTYRLNALNED